MKDIQKESGDIKRDLEALSREIDQLSGEMKHDTFLQIIAVSDVVNRFLTLKLKRTRAHSTRYGILNILVSRGGTLGPTELGRAVFRSKFNITRVVDKMVRDGLVKRDASDKDQRYKKVTITEKGMQLVRDSMPERKEIAHDVTSFLSQEEMDLLHNMLRRLRKHLLKKIAEMTAE